MLNITKIFIVITTIIPLLQGQGIKVFQIRQEDCDTKCSNELLNEIDSFALNTTVLLTTELMNNSVVIFEIMPKTSTAFNYLFSVDIKSDCTQSKKPGSNYHCSQIADNMFNISITSKAVTSLSQATIRGQIKHYNLTLIAQSEQNLPKICEPTDVFSHLTINGQNVTDTENCTLTLNEDDLSLEFECIGPAKPCLIDLRASDTNDKVTGEDKVVIQRLIHEDVQLEIRHALCRLDTKVINISCTVFKGPNKHHKMAMILAICTGIPTIIILLSVIVCSVCKLTLNRRRPAVKEQNTKLTPLLNEPQNNNRETTVVLCEHRSTINDQNYSSDIPLNSDADHGHTAVNQTPEGSISNFEMPPNNGSGELMMASLHGVAYTIETLIDKEADVYKSTNAASNVYTIEDSEAKLEETQLLEAKIISNGAFEKNSIHDLTDASVNWQVEDQVEDMTSLLKGGVDVYNTKSNDDTELMDSTQSRNKGGTFSKDTNTTATTSLCADQNTNLETASLLLEHGSNRTGKKDNSLRRLNLVTQHGQNDITQTTTDSIAIVEDPAITGTNSLMIASLNGNTETVKNLIHQGADVNKSNKEGFTALMFASQNGHTEIAEMLIKGIASTTHTKIKKHTKLKYAEIHGAAVNDKNAYGNSALMFAAMNGHSQTVATLIKYGANIKEKDDNGLTALMLASLSGHTETVKTLLNHKANIKKKNKDGLTSLMFASQNGRTATVKELISRGADVNEKNKRGVTALMVASANGHADTVQLLCENGATVKSKDLDKKNALMCAMGGDHRNIVDILLKLGAKVSSRHSGGVTRLMLAAKYGLTSTAENFIRNGVCVHDRDHADRTALMYASENGHTDTAYMLLRNGSNVNEKDDRGLNALMISSMNGHLEICRSLLQNEIDIKEKDNVDKTALMYAFEQKQDDVIDLLIEHGDDGNEKDKNGMNALMQEIQNGRIHNVSTLIIKNGADVNAEDLQGRTPLVIAAQKGFKNAAEILLKNGADINKKDKKKRTALMYAIQNNHVDIVELLIANGADCKEKLHNDFTYFMAAAQMGQTQIAELLLKNGVCPKDTTISGKTALMFACENGHKEMAEMIIKEAVDVNEINEDGQNALIFACKNGHTEIAKLLVQKDANTDVKDKYCLNAVNYALKYGLDTAAIFSHA
ncbi:unnamed protein product [Lymnaea stagnalis]|uniref:Uncharacterized protein n=1 Tax=Lymnaea stagnalis TaxID=6523 RepID=A0AAV2H3Z9_LYMST